MSCVTQDPDPEVAAAIARATHWREMLEELAEVGMTLAKDIAKRSMDAPYHPELKHDPGRSFAGAARAVRLSLILAARTNAEIIALRNGGVSTFGAAPTSGASRAPMEPGEPRRRHADARASDGAPEAIDRERGDGEAGERLRDDAREHLIEREDDDELPAGGVETCVAAIRADLRLEPDRGATLLMRPAVADVEVAPHRRQ